MTRKNTGLPDFMDPSMLHSFVMDYSMIYVLVDVGNTRRVETIVALHDRMIDEGQDTPDLIVIDAKPKQSASKA